MKPNAARATIAVLALLTIALGLAACAPRTPAQPPTNDVQPPATEPGSGDVMGADQVPPAQKLEEGPKLDAGEGIKPAEKPGE